MMKRRRKMKVRRISSPLPRFLMRRSLRLRVLENLLVR